MGKPRWVLVGVFALVACTPLTFKKTHPMVVVCQPRQLFLGDTVGCTYRLPDGTIPLGRVHWFYDTTTLRLLSRRTGYVVLYPTRGGWFDVRCVVRTAEGTVYSGSDAFVVYEKSPPVDGV